MCAAIYGDDVYAALHDERHSQIYPIDAWVDQPPENFQIEMPVAETI